MGRQQPTTRTRRWGRRLATMVIGLPRFPVSSGDRGIRSPAQPVGHRLASGPRLKRYTKSAPCRSRLLVGEVVPRASARRAACSKAQAATGTATVTNTNCRAPSLVLVRMLMPRFVATKPIAGRIERLARQQVEHDGEDHRGDDREQDHQ
jgi:hypothetical protein